MTPKRNLRVLFFTGALLVLIYFIVQHANTTSTDLDGSILDDGRTNTAKSVVTNLSVKAGAKAKLKPEEAVKTDAKVDEEIESIKQEIGIKENIGDKLPKVQDLAQDAEFDAAKEYQMILVSAPMIVFSKSGCPFSKRMKELLAQEFLFTPEYRVVELDKHEHMAALQSYIGVQTGRSTVPNVVINGKSRGGFDDFKALHDEGKLLKSLKDWAGKEFTVTKKEKPSNS
ncbi:LAME_0G11078g1_1 [Lachancea meyersii CBS 8951]|uniref:LAME_0G11078g1_1 n=1 Tax=Lachancea meyersii CBS 8951 TaxID=1266667 RepID=A0A1G4K970_9SACH|nr:LAME_0G11078g1_1 [Lachancea meyersii CBS 8951]